MTIDLHASPSLADLAETDRGQLTVPNRYAGPPGWANGGFLCGTLAQMLGAQAATVTLHRPVPTDTPIAWQRHDAHTLVLTGAGEVYARAVADAGPDAPSEDEPSVAMPPSGAQAWESDWADHPFPHCFVCGPKRSPGDGLRILPAARSGPVLLAPWTPTGASPGTAVPSPLIWAALDCPGGFAALDGGRARPILLGRMCARLEAEVLAGEPCTVTAVRTGGHGRRHDTRTAIFDRHGRRCAIALCTWVEPRAA